MIPKTITELKDWMTKHCYNFNNYSIGGNQIDEGHGLEDWGGLYIWFYTERGNRENKEYFSTEKDAVQYAYEIISKDKFANSYYISNTADPNVKELILKNLEKNAINFWVDEVGYPSGEKLYRIFAIGCDNSKLKNLKF